MRSLSTALNAGTLSRKYRFIKTMYLNIMWLGRKQKQRLSLARGSLQQKVFVEITS